MRQPKADLIARIIITVVVLLLIFGFIASFFWGGIKVHCCLFEGLTEKLKTTFGF